LTKTTYLIDYNEVSSDYVTIGTQLLSQLANGATLEPGQPWEERVPPPGPDGTLLAVVPIPGTQTSLAIVGYAISTAAEPERPADAPGPAWAAEPSRDTEPARDTRPARAGRAGSGGGGLLIDRVQRRVWTQGGEIPMTFQEFELLAFLSAHPAVVFSRVDLLQHVWQPPGELDRHDVRPGSRTVDVHVSRLRRKLGPVYGQCLVTEHRAGYQFRPLAVDAPRP
jgi:Transcriptional regulatory protein, C terminal